MACTMATIIVTLLAVRADAVTPTPELPPFQVYTTPAGTEFGLTLPRANATSGGAPPRLAIALASTINDTLGRLVMSGCPSAYYFANACPWLVEQGWACASLDLPSHGKQIMPGEPSGGIAGWRWRTDRGIDFVEQSQQRLEDMVSYLAKHKLASDEGIFIAGISRGGFLAAQYAARSPPLRVAAVGLLSPVTNLSLLTEFAHENASMQEILRPKDVIRQAAALAPKNIFAIIGDEDPRVFTDSCVRTVRAVQCHGCDATGPYFPEYSCSGCPATHGDTQLRVYREPNGHTVPPHEDPASTFSELASWVLRVTARGSAAAPPGPSPLSLLAATAKPVAARSRAVCALNGVPDEATGICKCDPGWKGTRCAELNVQPAPSDGRYGLHAHATPTWGGGAVFEDGHWHLIVGARAVASPNDAITDYPCDSKIVRAVSAGSDVAGPYEIVENVVNRTSWEPALARSPKGELLMMFFGNLSNPPPVGSAACAMPSTEFNVTATNTYVSVSATGSAKGPWSTPRLARGMENQPTEGGATGGRGGGYSWSCASGNPSPAFHPNGTLFAALRQNPCWKGFSTREHIGLWRADNGWDGAWTLVNPDAPLYGWGGGSERDCTDENGCPSHEDPHLWWDEEGGGHLLTHDQNNHVIHSTRGAYGWSSDGLSWTLETPMFEPPDDGAADGGAADDGAAGGGAADGSSGGAADGAADGGSGSGSGGGGGSGALLRLSNASAWPMGVAFDNHTVRPLARRQRPSLIYDPHTGEPTHVMQGADFSHHAGPPGGGVWCEGCHWGSGFTLIQPLA